MTVQTVILCGEGARPSGMSSQGSTEELGTFKAMKSGEMQAHNCTKNHAIRRKDAYIESISRVSPEKYFVNPD
jgi:hypothetical protein